MATLSPRNPNLLDVAKAQDPDGSIAKVAELLAQTNPIIPDLPMIEGNLQTGHQHTIRSGLPEVFWRRAYKGVPTSKSTRATVTDTCGNLQARTEVDAKLAKLNGNLADFRLSEAQAFIEAMNQKMAATFFYGNQGTEPEAFHGIAPRYNALAGSDSARNVLSAGGAAAGAQTSLYLVVFGENTVHGIYPKGTKAGLGHKDLGEIDAFDSDGNRFRAYADLWDWDLGLTVRDWRYVVRVANVQVADLISAGLGDTTPTQAKNAGTNLLRQAAMAAELIPNLSMGKAVFYGSRAVAAAIRNIAMEKSSSAVGYVEQSREQYGMPGQDLTLHGIPFRRVDAILHTEAVVV